LRKLLVVNIHLPDRSTAVSKISLRKR